MKKEAMQERGAPYDLEELERLLTLLQGKGIAEFELEREGYKLRLRFAAQSAEAAHPITPAAPCVMPEAEGLHIVRAPIVGAVLRAPSAGSAPYVSVGDRVEADAVLCVVEAMKFKNEVAAGAAGVVTKIFVEDEQAIEYGQPLFALRTA